MAEYTGVNLSGSTDGGACDHDGIEPPGAIEYGEVSILGTYPYEAKIRVYVVFPDDHERQEDVYTSAGGLAGQYLGSVEVLSPTSIRLRVRRLGGFPKGPVLFYVERA